MRYNRKLQAYEAKWPNGTTEYFGRDLIIVDHCKGPLMVEPNANKKAVKVAKVKHSNLTFRTRDAELMILRAFYDTLKELRTDAAKQEALVSLLKEHPWVQVYIRAALDPNRKYRLQSVHLKKLKNYKPAKTNDSIFVVLTGLQFNKYEPIEAVRKWHDVLDGLQPEGHKIANMILDKQFCGFSRKECNQAMKAAGILILIPKRHEDEQG